MPGVSHSGRPRQRARGLAGGRRDTPKPDDAAARPRAAGGRIDAATGAAGWAPACCSCRQRVRGRRRRHSARPRPRAARSACPIVPRATEETDEPVGATSQRSVWFSCLCISRQLTLACLHSTPHLRGDCAHLWGRGTRRLGWAADKCPKGQGNSFGTCWKTSAG